MDDVLLCDSESNSMESGDSALVSGDAQRGDCLTKMFAFKFRRCPAHTTRFKFTWKGVNGHLFPVATKSPVAISDDKGLPSLSTESP